MLEAERLRVMVRAASNATPTIMNQRTLPASGRGYGVFIIMILEKHAGAGGSISFLGTPNSMGFAIVWQFDL